MKKYCFDLKFNFPPKVPLIESIFPFYQYLSLVATHQQPERMFSRIFRDVLLAIDAKYDLKTNWNERTSGLWLFIYMRQSMLNQQLKVEAFSSTITEQLLNFKNPLKVFASHTVKQVQQAIRRDLSTRRHHIPLTSIFLSAQKPRMHNVFLLPFLQLAGS